MKPIGRTLAQIATAAIVPPEFAKVIYDGLWRPVDETKPRDRISLTEIVEALKLCESPIEKLMLIGILTMPCDAVVHVHDPMAGEPFPQTSVVVTPQFVISRYRLDFLITVRRSNGSIMNFAVECDGINFHGDIEKRKEDAERDKYLEHFGIKTVRYYGQKIRRLGHLCADEIAAVVNEELASV